MGQHCAVRVQLYHALWHYKRRMRGKLKKQLKKSRQFLQVSFACALPPFCCSSLSLISFSRMKRYLQSWPAAVAQT